MRDGAKPKTFWSKNPGSDAQITLKGRKKCRKISILQGTRPKANYFLSPVLPDLESCVYKLTPSLKSHCCGRDDAVARREVSWLNEIFSVIL